MSRSAGQSGPKKSVALFDVDGTLTDGYTIFSFAEFLGEKDLFLPSCLSLMRTDRAIYQGSARGESDYHEFVVKLVDHYAQGLKDQHADEVGSFSAEFLDAALQNKIAGYRIHRFARDLVQMLNPIAGTVAISGSPSESLSGLAAYLGFQEVFATRIEVEQGRFTGRVDHNLAIRESKGQWVSSYLAGNFNLNTSFAFGDSVQDVPLLEAVGSAFVVGGNEELRALARQRGWQVISAEDDVIGIVKTRIATLFGA